MRAATTRLHPFTYSAGLVRHRETTEMSLAFQPVTGRVGAIVEGPRVTDLTDEQFAEVHQAVLRHKVLFFRGQFLTDAEQEAFARRFGDLVVHPTTPSEDNTAGILEVDSERSRANSWQDRKSTRLNSSHVKSSYAVFCLKKK